MQNLERSQKSNVEKSGEGTLFVQLLAKKSDC